MYDEQKFEEFKSIIEILNGDVQHIIECLENRSIDFNFGTRSYIRAYASWIEGSVWLLKQLIRSHENQWHKNMTLACQLYLFEHDWQIKDSGEPSLTTKKIATKKNIQALFFVATQLNPNFKISFEEKGWSDVKHFYSLRDNLMHPKSLRSLDIAKEDLRRCDEGRLWLFSKFADVAKIILA